MRRQLQKFLSAVITALQPRPSQAVLELRATVRDLAEQLTDTAVRQQSQRLQYVERCHELQEARQMGGSGPWLAEGYRSGVDTPGRLQESQASLASMADLELALESLEWRREVNFSWLEFSRWGIQQIILLSRLYFVKNPWIQRGINVAAQYVFGRGMEVSSSDATANKVLEDFFERNKSVLGHIGLTDLERRKYYDGNLFFCFFADKASTGLVNIRTIDATEIQDIVTNPEDTDEPWFYRRCWTARVFDAGTGRTRTETRESWYPALNYEPTPRPEVINGITVEWEHPILHRRCGAVSKWLFGCPLVYAALDWSREGRKFLEACATVKQALAQIAMTITTKGGQAAIAGAKQQLQTATGPPNSLWDTNPDAVKGAVFASGPGTTLEAFNTKGAGGDPAEVREFRNMVACVLGIPPTFLADLETANLATATTLDRPTELNFLEKQETWREDMLTIAKYVLRVSAGASGGLLRESVKDVGVKVTICEAPRHAVKTNCGNTVYRMKASKQVPAGTVEVVCNFPAILEGDVAALINATAIAHKTGTLDDKTVALQLYDLLPGVDNGIEIAEGQYPEGSYDPDKTKEPVAAPTDPNAIKPAEAAAKRLARRLIAEVSEEHNGHAQHVRG